jgi:hypothetical protein
MRQDLANDPLNLLATSGPINQAKGDADAATWLPPNKAIRCTYVARQVAVKVKYHLWVTSPEKDAINRVLAKCPGQALDTDGTGRLVVVPAQPQRPGTTTASGPASGGSKGSLDPRFTSCRLAKAAGYGPYRRDTDPEYGWYHDGDGDGISCEP